MSNIMNIVMYHYVRDKKKSKYPAIKGMDISEFREQIKFIKKNFNTISAEELMQYYKSLGREKLPPNPFLLTFDDGYIDNYEYVLPILEENNIKGAFFPVTKAVRDHKLLDVNKIHYILASADLDCLIKDVFEALDKYRKSGQLNIDGKEYPSNEELFLELAVANRWDPKEVIFVKRLLQNKLPEKIRNEIASSLFEKYIDLSQEEFAKKLYLNEEQIKEMRKLGHFFGIHGSGHYWMAKITKEEMENDILEALSYFDDMGVIDKKSWVMNYPYGNYSDELIDFIKSKNCCFGVTVDAKKANLLEDDRFLLPRWDANDLPPRASEKRILS